MIVDVINLKKSGEANSTLLNLFTHNDTPISSDDIIPPLFEGSEPYFIMKRSELFVQCIDAIAESTCGYNYTLMLNDKPAPDTPEMKYTRDMIENINPNKPFIEVLKQNVRDIQAFGYTGVEILLSNDETEFELLNVPVHELRICRRDRESTEFEIPGKTRRWKFRRYAQVQGNDKVFFKELYDPRLISRYDGRLTNELDKSANPLLWIDNGNYTNHAYPIVLWHSIGYAALSIGAIHELNYKYFKNGRIDTQVLLVSGGDYTPEEAKRIASLLEQSKGVDNAGSIIVIQASPTTIETAGGLEEKVSPVKLDLKPLTPPQSNDPQYLEFLDDCRKAVMSAFRVPPIILGYSGDYNRATSEEATETFYTKVILPLQQKLENAYNKLLMYCGNPYRIRLNNPYRDLDKIKEKSEDINND